MLYKDLNNTNNLKEYAEKTSPAIKKYNGKILVRCEKAETVKDALKYYNSDDYLEAKKIVKGNLNRHVQIVEGI